MTDEQTIAFWSKVDIPDDKFACWNWRGARKPKGYGNLKINSEYVSAHRTAFELCSGVTVPDGLIVCHVCDNPSCCNPRHLMLGTILSNTGDMVFKNRHKFNDPKPMSRGENNQNAKLKESDVIQIRKDYDAGIANQYELADRYGVTQPTIGHVVRRTTWRNI